MRNAAVVLLIALTAGCEPVLEPVDHPPSKIDGVSTGGCGDGTRDGDEACDGDDLGGATCGSLIRGANGTLRCSSFCSFDTSGCTPHVACGPTGGLAEGAPWPTIGRCPSHPARGEARVAPMPSAAWTHGGSFLGSPAIAADGTSFVGAELEGEHVLAAIAKDGSVAWSAETRPIQTTPALLRGGTIVVGEERSPSAKGSLLAFDARGERRWAIGRDGDGDWSSAVPGDDGTIYVGCPGPALCAIDPSGEVLWARKLGRLAWWSAPAIAADGTIVIAASEGIFALAPDGSSLWSRFDLPALDAPPPLLAPDGSTFVAIPRLGLVALRKDGTTRFELDDPRVVAVHASLAIGDDGTIVLGGDDGVLRAIAPDGTTLWSVDVQGLGPTVLAGDGTVLANDGNVRAYAPGGALLWKFAAEMGGTSTPAIGADGGLVLAGSSLFALGP